MRQGAFALGITGLLWANDPSTIARRITYRETDTPIVYLQLGYVTSIYLPKNEQILPLSWVGDAHFFDVTASGNVLYVTPLDLAKSKDPNTGGKRSNVAIRSVSGNHFDFELIEVSKSSTDKADLKVFVDEADETMKQRAAGPPEFVPASESNTLKQEVETLRKQVAQADAAKKEITQTAGVRAVLSLDHNYELFDKKGKGELNAVIFRDDKYTYIDLGNTDEAPSVWELKDDKFSKVETLLQGGKYTIQHKVNEGELKIGRTSIRFRYVGQA
ncbi:MAG: hypothetical protein NVS1B11_37010 [Terriglobales bacterium]